MADVEMDNLVQLLAVLVSRLGGEVVISQNEFDAFEGLPVLARNLSSTYLLLHLPEEEEFIDMDRMPEPSK